MSLAVSCISSAVANNVQAYFFASGGTSPYTFAVLVGGAGGSIGSSSGIYTAPGTGVGTDTIQVTDNVGATATTTIMVGNIPMLICDIIQNQLGLSQGQVNLWNQKVLIPTDSRLYVAVGVMNCKVIGNINRPDVVSSQFVGSQSISMQATLSIDIYSRGLDALNRKEELVMALNSTYAETQQELNGFRLGITPTSFVNVSNEEGAAILYRFNIAVNVLYSIIKNVQQGDYDTLQGPNLTFNS